MSTVNCCCLSAFFFCQIDHSFSCSLFLIFFPSSRSDIRHCYERKYRATMFIHYFIARIKKSRWRRERQRRKKRHTYTMTRKGERIPLFSCHLYPYLPLIISTHLRSRALINCMYTRKLPFAVMVHLLFVYIYTLHMLIWRRRKNCTKNVIVKRNPLSSLCLHLQSVAIANNCNCQYTINKRMTQKQ